MAEEAATRYEQRIMIISHQLVKTPRRVYHNQRAQYTVTTSHRSMGEFGHVAAKEMYGAMLKEKSKRPDKTRSWKWLTRWMPHRKTTRKTIV